MWQNRHEPATKLQPHLWPSVQWEILRGVARNRMRPVRGQAFLLGSAIDCDLVLSDPQFPAVHAYLLRRPSEISLRWLGFGPPLSVNGKVVEDVAFLDDQDTIRAAGYEFRVHIQSPTIDPGRDESAEELTLSLASRTLDESLEASGPLGSLRGMDPRADETHEEEKRPSRSRPRLRIYRGYSNPVDQELCDATGS